MENSNWFQNLKTSTMKWIKRILILLIISTIAIFCFAYWGSYSEGSRSGMVIKISKKGFIFKTYEGQLNEGRVNLQALDANKSPTLSSDYFEFSVESDREDIIKILEETSLSGERVSLKYVEHLMVFPWRGETKYFVIDVKRLK